jgi:hypothetical protein
MDDDRDGHVEIHETKEVCFLFFFLTELKWYLKQTFSNKKVHD